MSGIEYSHKNTPCIISLNGKPFGNITKTEDNLHFVIAIKRNYLNPSEPVVDQDSLLYTRTLKQAKVLVETITEFMMLEPLMDALLPTNELYSRCGNFIINDKAYVYRLSPDTQQRTRIGEVTYHKQYECYLMPNKGKGNRNYPCFSAENLTNLGELMERWCAQRPASDTPDLPA